MRTSASPITTSDSERASAGAPTTGNPLQAAVEHVVATGPAFLSGDIDADAMATKMVDAVRSYSDQRRVNDLEDPQLKMVLSEIYGCGSGYLAGRCDGACVARTMTVLVNEFGNQQ